MIRKTVTRPSPAAGRALSLRRAMVAALTQPHEHGSLGLEAPLAGGHGGKQMRVADLGVDLQEGHQKKPHSRPESDEHQCHDRARGAHGAAVELLPNSIWLLASCTAISFPGPGVLAYDS